MRRYEMIGYLSRSGCFTNRMSLIVAERNCEKKNPEKKKRKLIYLSFIKNVSNIKKIENKGIV
jgi:hypothetical protein